jgi:low affinity Fe/Cu permease
MMNDLFRKFASGTSKAAGSSWTFLLAVLLVVIWALTGPVFKFSQTWQLVINTGTTIITFLMVFLIQNTQNRDSAAIHLKLDELLRSTENATNSLIDSEHLSDQDLENLRAVFLKFKNEEGIGNDASVKKLQDILFNCDDGECE